MRIQFILIALSLTSSLLARGELAESAEGDPAKLSERSMGPPTAQDSDILDPSSAIRNRETERPLHLQPLDFSREDLGVADKLARIKAAPGSPERAFTKGLIYKRAAIDLYNRGHYKRAHALFQKAEADLLQAAENYGRRKAQEPPSETLRSSQSEARAYYHLATVCELIRNDKTVAAECYRKALELDPEDDHIKAKLVRTKEGRARLGSRAAQAFREKREAAFREKRKEEEGK